MINTERRIMNAILVHVDEHKKIRCRLAASRDARRSLIPVGFRDAVEPDAHFIASGAGRGSSPASGGNGRIVSRTSVNARVFAVGKQCAILYQIGSSVDVHVSGRPRIPENRAVTQLHAAVRALEKLGTRIRVIGLAKQLEEIYRTDSPEPLRLPRNSPALHLIQRLRDEAHRFANSYHQKLRQRRIQESVLDEIDGLGEKKKVALLKHFGSIQRLRLAGVEPLANVPGIGPKLAAKLQEFLTRS